MSSLSEWSGNKTVFIVSITLVALSFVVVALRFISRTVVRGRITVDDWLILLAWLLAFGMSFALCIRSKYGLESNEPLTDASGERNPEVRRKARFAVVFLYHPTCMATKTSILFFYLSLFKNFKPLKWGAWITMGVVGIGGFVLTMLILFQCKPVSAVFSASQLESKCLNIITILYASAPLNIITDLAILLLPMPVLTSLNLPQKEKVVVICLFAGGGFVAVVGVVRIYFLDKAVVSNNFGSDVSLSFMWSAIEVNVGIVCASIPMLKPLVVILIPSLFSHETAHTPEMQGLRIHQSGYQSGTPELDMHGTMSNSFGTQGLSLNTGISNNNTDSAWSCRNTRGLFLTTPASQTCPVGASIRYVWKPLLLVTVLFFFWGFSYGLIGVLRAKFGVLYNLSTSQALVLEGVYFAPYLVTPRLFSGILLKKYGFKATFIAGLLSYTTGCLIFWPAGALGTFPGFVVAAIATGIGVATIETAANPYVALVGPLGMGEARLGIAQGFQAVGTICASLLEYCPIFSRIPDNTKGVADMNWVFLAIVLFMVSLSVIFYYFPLPEIRDEECPSILICESSSFWKSKCVTGSILAVVTIFLYVGAQEMFVVFWENYFISIGIREDKTKMNWKMLGFGLFAAGRFVAGIALLWLCPRVILVGSLIGCIITSVLAITCTGKTAATMLILNRLFQSSIFPTVFGMGLRGLGQHTKTVAIYLVTGICGGTVLLDVYYTVAKYRGYSYAMLVPAIIFGVCLVFPIYCYISPEHRKFYGCYIRGDTTGALRNVPPMTMEIYQYVRRRLSTKHLGHPESTDEAV